MSENAGPKSSTTGEADLEALRERVHVYESFDSVISENIANAKNILVEAAELRERVTREVTQEREALYAEIADKRARLDAEFVGLRASFDADLQARRAEFEHELVALRASTDNDLVATRQLIVDEQNRFVAAQMKIAATARAILGMVEATPAPEAPAPVKTAPPKPAIVSPANPAEPIEATEPAPSQPVLPSPTPEAVRAQNAEVPAAPKGDPAKTTIIIHGINRPVVATGLQRYLLSKDGVISVEPREFAEGILRLQVRATTPITESLFTGWDDGEGMTVIQRLPQTVEIVLPTAG
jgi:hypothetical protein